MKNVTITMSDHLVRQARIEAVKQGKSLSRFLSDLVEQRVGRRPSQRDAIERFLAAPLLPLTDDNGRPPRREEIYDDALLHRYEHSRLRKRSKNSSQT